MTIPVIIKADGSYDVSAMRHYFIVQMRELQARIDRERDERLRSSFRGNQHHRLLLGRR